MPIVYPGGGGSAGFAFAKAYGAKGDGKTYDTAAMANGSNVVTVTGGSFTQADVGKLVWVLAANVGGVLLTRDQAGGTPDQVKIASVQSATQATLTKPAGVDIANTTISYATDDTVALQAWLTAAGSLGMIAVWDPGRYMVSWTSAGTPALGGSILSVPSGLTIIGAGANETIVDAFGVITTNYNSWEGSIIKGADNGSRFSWQGFQVIGPANAAATAVQRCIDPGAAGGAYKLENIFTTWGSCGVFASANTASTWINVRSQNASIVGHYLEACSELQLIGCLPQTTAGVNDTNAVCANLLITDNGVASNPCHDIEVFAPLIDEMGPSKDSGGASVWVKNGVDVRLNIGRVFPAGKQTGAASAGGYYGVRIGPNSKRVHLNSTRIEPFTADATRVPNHTVFIEAGATDCELNGVTTDPNLANGGGDILDQGTRTKWREVSMNGGPFVSTLPTKAGVPSDADYQVAPPVGTQVLDTTDGKIYYRTAAATWKAATLT